jgi:hypothetical protein
MDGIFINCESFNIKAHSFEAIVENKFWASWTLAKLYSVNISST